jgi:hypothetical protein
MILTVLLIILIISVNVINAFALEGIVSPSSVHVHTFKRVIESINYKDYNMYRHIVTTSGYLNCTTCYHSELFSEESLKTHTASGDYCLGNDIHMYWSYCGLCYADYQDPRPCEGH